MLMQIGELVRPLRQVRGVFYGWWLVGMAALVMVLSSGPLSQSLSAWFVVLERQFRWSRTQLTLSFALTRVEGSIMGPIGGYLIDKLGPRLMVFIGLLVLGGGFILLSQVHSLWMFYLAFLVMSMGQGLGTWMPMMTVLNSWFIRRRSMAMALALEGFYIGGITLVPLIVWAIDPDEPGRIGWRATAIVIGIIILALAFPISLIVRNRPEDYGAYPDGDRPDDNRPDGSGPDSGKPASASISVGDSGAQQAEARPTEDGPEYTWQQAIRTKTFWLISIGHSCSSIVMVALMAQLGPMLNIDRGLSLQTVGWVIATYTGVGAVFTLIGGYVGDRVPIRYAIFGFSAIQSAAVIIVLYAHSAFMAYAFAVVLGIGFGGRSPLTTSIPGVYFGRKAFASITGISMLPMNVMLLAAPLFAAFMRDRVGSYDIPFITITAVSGFGAFLFLLLGEPKPLAASHPPD